MKTQKMGQDTLKSLQWLLFRHRVKFKIHYSACPSQTTTVPSQPPPLLTLLLPGWSLCRTCDTPGMLQLKELHLAVSPARDGPGPATHQLSSFTSFSSLLNCYLALSDLFKIVSPSWPFAAFLISFPLLTFPQNT